MRIRSYRVGHAHHPGEPELRRYRAHPHPGPVRRPGRGHADHSASHGRHDHADRSRRRWGGFAPQQFRNSCNPAVAALPPTVEGKPALNPGAVDGVAELGLYIWHEAKGWRVRLTHNLPKVDVNEVSKPQLVEVRGRITASRPISNVRTVRLEDKQRGEWVSVQRPKRKVMDFRFVNGGYIDGINFNAGCAGRLGFTVWQVTKAEGGIIRTPLPIFVGPVSCSQRVARVTMRRCTRSAWSRSPRPPRWLGLALDDDGLWGPAGPLRRPAAHGQPEWWLPGPRRDRPHRASRGRDDAGGHEQPRECPRRGRGAAWKFRYLLVPSVPSRPPSRTPPLALWLIIDAFRGGDAAAARVIPDAAQSLVDRGEEVAELASRYRFTDRLVTTGRGYSYPTAREAALELDGDLLRGRPCLLRRRPSAWPAGDD